ncbi:hypothetical protein V1477_006473 [Vespula maculifrons]|uniref:Uncharacterized protein n=1 Tax=Vespula maculifrons TaxID=7453 RepID=A0ABD2CJ24_VESMC
MIHIINKTIRPTLNIIKTQISIYRKYYRPRSHRVEVAALWDPRANGESTLKSANRDAFPLRELRASQQTGDISIFRKYYRPGSHRLEVAAAGDPRTNGDSTLKSTIRDAFPLWEIRASQQTGDISIFRKYYRPGSHRLEVAAAGDPRTNGDSTLKSTIRDAFPLRELRASQETGDV